MNIIDVCPVCAKGKIEADVTGPDPDVGIPNAYIEGMACTNADCLFNSVIADITDHDDGDVFGSIAALVMALVQERDESTSGASIITQLIETLDESEKDDWDDATTSDKFSDIARAARSR